MLQTFLSDFFATTVLYLIEIGSGSEFLEESMLAPYVPKGAMKALID